MTAISVLVRLADGQDAAPLVASLDVQSLDTDDFEVVWSLDPDTVEPVRLAAWLGLRPNHRLGPRWTEGDPVDAGSRPEAYGACRGRWVLPVQGDDRLFPDALARVLGVGDAADADVVVGRAARPGLPVPPAGSEADAVVAVRGTSAGTDGTAAEQSGRRASLTGRAVLLRPADEPPTRAVLPVPEVGWVGAELVVSAVADGLAPPYLGLLQHAEGQTLLVPVAAEEVEGSTGGPVLRLDPRSADDGQPLATGAWRVLLQGSGPDGEPQVRSLAWQPAPAALLGATGVVPFDADGTLALDVGPGAHPLVTTHDPGDGVVQQRPTGARLVLSLPELLTVDAVGRPAGLVIGRMRVPAELVVDGAGARLEAWLSGVQGVAPLGLELAPGGQNPLGLSLDIAPSGEMRLVRTPEPEPPAPAAGPGSAARPRTARKPRPRRGVLAAARRRVPAAVEPVVAAASRWEPARRLYRRLTH